MVAEIKNKILPQFEPIAWVLSNGVEDTSLQQFSIGSNFSGIVWTVSCVIVFKEFVSMFNKENRKHTLSTFYSSSCKEGKNASSITRIL